MSFDLFVYLRRSAMPTPREWYRGIKESGFPVDLETDFDRDEHTGFLPCNFRGQQSGFEYSSRRLDDDEKRECEIPDDLDFVVTFATGANLREFATSLIAAGTLCWLAVGILVDPQSGESYRAEKEMKIGREGLG